MATAEYAASLASVREAAARIRDHVIRTPVMTCSTLDQLSGHRLFFKCENFQKGGAFKIRGATNALFSVDAATAAKGVVTHSSGNHAQACALAARARGVPAHIVMPNTAPQVKKNAVRGYGARVIECDPLERAAMAAKVAKDTGGLLVHPSNDPRVISGQGTVALELLEQIGTMDGVAAGNGSPIDFLVVPLGGGGLISGICAAAKGLYPDLRIIAAEPLCADDGFRSKAAGQLLGHAEGHPNTVADGLCTTLGSNTFPFVRDMVDEVVTVDEAQIAAGMRLVYERMKLVIEPSAGTGVAVVLSPRFREIAGENKRVAVVLCGGNVDLGRMAEYMALADMKK